ncbi:MAG: molybdenum cofactor biosynthesis protein B [Gammaproteobacteria bacterium]|tara:strand:+ start:80 stop:580 length:501 start_codon:yes stop_codon:yes gene_type:complete
MKKLNIAVVIVSDTRTDDTDKSGKKLKSLIETDGHSLVSKIIIKDNIYQIRKVLSEHIVDDAVDAVIISGGTGITGSDGTPEAVIPLLDKIIDGFGEIFRLKSYEKIKTSSLQSRAVAGVANKTFIFVLPGSTDACITAWEEIISHQLNSDTKPCNLVMLMPRLNE